MYVPRAAAIMLVLSILPGSAFAAPSATFSDEPSRQAARIPCPIPGWRGECARMDEEQRQRIRAAIAKHARLTLATCVAAHDLLLEWLDNPLTEVWTFEHHKRDTRTTYLMGEAVRDLAGQPQGFGLHAVAFRTVTRTLARVALHEAAHLAGEAEEGARRVERECLA
jgi:hypothetical protein